jgi:hypothetical protein
VFVKVDTPRIVAMSNWGCGLMGSKGGVNPWDAFSRGTGARAWGSSLGCNIPYLYFINAISPSFSFSFFLSKGASNDAKTELLWNHKYGNTLSDLFLVFGIY